LTLTPPEDLTTVSSSKSYEELSQARRDLAYFWDMWSSVLDVCEYVQPDPLELLMLTWLEFALALKQTSSQEDLVKYICSSLRKSAGRRLKKSVTKPDKDLYGCHNNPQLRYSLTIST
jgi:hypothetical protein